jgi:DNA-binding winged helix-turn-helix (wHTH) protein
MPAPLQPARYRFGVFEADAATGELRKQGIRIKVNVQPFQVLLLLLARPNEILTRDDLARVLWPEGTFVDFEHGVNSAVNRIREALGDSARNPRFIETLARRGYRFIAPVERLDPAAKPVAPGPASETCEETSTAPASRPQPTYLAAPHELPSIPARTVRGLFLALQLMYLGYYVGALANLAEIEDLFAPLAHAHAMMLVLVVSAALLIPVRVFLVTAMLFRAPGLRRKYLLLWPALLAADVLWALSPFLLLHHINVGLATACMAPLVYSPFAQRALILMDAE